MEKLLNGLTLEETEARASKGFPEDILALVARVRELDSELDELYYEIAYEVAK